VKVADPLMVGAGSQTPFGSHSGHQLYQPVLGDLVAAENSDVDAVPKDRGPVSERCELGDAVGNDDHAGTLRTQPFHFRIQPGCARKVQGGSRFIEDDDFWRADERTGDRDPLAVSQGQRVHQS
jgi:hypothetical protein